MNAGQASTGRTFAESLGARFQPAPGVLLATATRLRAFARCPRSYFLAELLGLAADAEEPHASAGLGLGVHAELDARHRSPERHDDADAVDTSGAATDEVVRVARLHHAVCPAGEGARYLGGEIDLRWFVARRNVLVAGRVDALWRWPDGTLEVRDYKTGAVPAHLADDTAALVYALLMRAQPAYRGAPLRITYEALRGDRATLTSFAVADDDVRRAWQLIERFERAIRAESTFAATPSPEVCGACGHRRVCPDATTEPRRRAPGGAHLRVVPPWADDDMDADDIDADDIDADDIDADRLDDALHDAGSNDH